MPASDDTQPAMTYPSKQQYARWKRRAQELDMSLSEFVQSMVEAGMKVDRGFEIALEHDETRRELRAQRNALQEELDQRRQRISELEERVYHGERAEIREVIDHTPGLEFGEIVQHVIDTVPERVVAHLEDLEGDEIFVDENDRFYPTNRSHGDGEGRTVD